MDFTREPIVESIVTPRDGHRIVVRSSKNGGHEEYFLDALEIVSFGNTTFFRSTEKPKPFLVPAADYEVLEVREPRVFLKVPVFEGAVKPSQAKEQPPFARPPKDLPPLRETSFEEDIDEEPLTSLAQNEVSQETSEPEASVPLADGRQEKRKDKKSKFKKRKGPRDSLVEEEGKDKEPSKLPVEPSVTSTPVSVPQEEKKKVVAAVAPPTPPTLLPPPTTLIRDDIERLRKTDSFKGAFFAKDEKVAKIEDMVQEVSVPVEKPMVVEEVEEISEEVSPDTYKATPAKSETKELSREPFWGV